MGEVVVAQVEGTEGGHVAQLGGDPLHLVPLHGQVLQLCQLGHLGWNGPGQPRVSVKICWSKKVNLLSHWLTFVCHFKFK